MGRIIKLQGKGNSGKTSTINMLPRLLNNAGYGQVPGMFQPHGKDFVDVFEKGKKRVGVTSFGDSYKVVHESLTYLIAAGCGVCVCACRTRDNGTHGTNTAAEGFPRYTIQTVEKNLNTAVSRHDAENALDARRLLREIQRF